jgi:hypothetical protein
VIGGVNLDEGVLKSCEKYDINKDLWYEFKDMNIERKNASMCALTSDTIYVFGGTC